MARRFDAPIPIYRQFGFPDRRAYDEVDEGMVYSFLTELVFGAPTPAPSPIREAAAAILAMEKVSSKEWWTDTWIELSHLLQAFQVERLVKQIGYHFAYTAALKSQDALAVDDWAFLFVYPGLEDDFASLLRYFEAVRGSSDSGEWKELRDEVGRWIERRVPDAPRHPRLRTTTVEALAGLEAAGPGCWHSRDHEEFARPGRKWKIERRAATWGTYILAWVLGEETLAVKLWNKLLLPDGFRWGGASNSLDYALKKYLDAKKRLEKDLLRTVGPGLRPRYATRPNHPIRPAVADHLERLIEGTVREYWQQALSGLYVKSDGGRESTVPASPLAILGATA